MLTIPTIGTRLGGAIVAMMLAMMLTPWSACAADGVELNLETATIQISTFYNGTTLKVEGTLPADADVVLRVSGLNEEVHLKEKGKVAGFLWMNKNDVTLENTPAIYMVYTPEDHHKTFIGPELGIGYKALLKEMTIEPESADKGFIFGEYVKLKEESGSYAVNETAISYGAVTGDTKTFQAILNIPAKMSAGDYTVTAFTIKDGAVLSKADRALHLELSGLPATISKLAYGRPLLFGFMAVFIAIGAGLLIGVIFRGGGGAH